MAILGSLVIKFGHNLSQTVLTVHLRCDETHSDQPAYIPFILSVLDQMG